MGVLEETADDLAQLALEDEARSGDDKIVEEIAKILGTSSQTLEEAFKTAVRVRRAEARAREMLAGRKAAQTGQSGQTGA